MNHGARSPRTKGRRTTLTIGGRTYEAIFETPPEPAGQTVSRLLDAPGGQRASQQRAASSGSLVDALDRSRFGRSGLTSWRPAELGSEGGVRGRVARPFGNSGCGRAATAFARREPPTRRGAASLRPQTATMPRMSHRRRPPGPAFRDATLDPPEPPPDRCSRVQAQHAAFMRGARGRRTATAASARGAGLSPRRHVRLGRAGGRGSRPCRTGAAATVVVVGALPLRPGVRRSISVLAGGPRPFGGGHARRAREETGGRLEGGDVWSSTMATALRSA